MIDILDFILKIILYLPFVAIIVVCLLSFTVVAIVYSPIVVLIFFIRKLLNVE